MTAQCSLCIVVSFQLLLSCEDSPSPASLLKKAIEAHGGRDTIMKSRVGLVKGVSKGPPEITQEEWFDLPKRWKRVTRANFEGKARTAFNMEVEGKFWEWDEGGEAKQTKNEQKASSQFGFAIKLVEIVEGKFKLSALERIDIENQLALGIRADSADGAADFYFDKHTGLLAQVTFNYQREPGKEYEVKVILSDYKDADGVRFPYRRKYYIKGGSFPDYVPLGDASISEVRILNKLPEGTFSLPGKE